MPPKPRKCVDAGAEVSECPGKGGCDAVLAAHVRFVELVRVCNSERGTDLPDAVGKAIETRIAEGHLPGYLEDEKAKVFDMLLTEYDPVLQR